MGTQGRLEFQSSEAKTQEGLAGGRDGEHAQPELVTSLNPKSKEGECSTCWVTLPSVGRELGSCLPAASQSSG